MSWTARFEGPIMGIAAVFGQFQRSSLGDLLRRRAGAVVLAAAVAVAYYLTARLSLALLMEPDGVAVFWPAAGISSGVLIAVGPRARWPVACGTIAATIVANLMGDRNLEATIVFALSNAAEPVIVAGLIQYWFGARFNISRLQLVLGLLAAAVIGTAISGVGGAIGYKLFHSPTVPMLLTWRHWFASNLVGILTVAPLVIGLSAAVRKPLRTRNVAEALVALAALAATAAIIILLPREAWETVLPGALLAPPLLWLAARFRPVFTAAGAFIVSFTVVWTTTFGVGHFGGAGLPIEDRILQGQAFIVVVTLGALALAALFAERRRAEQSLARSKTLLERERDNKLMNVEAITALIAHEIRQPLSSIILNGGAALAFLARTPPACEEANDALNSIIADATHTNDAFDAIRALVKTVDEPSQPVDVNDVILSVLRSMRAELADRDVARQVDLAPDLPMVSGNKNQLQEVILNLIHNALEAMDTTQYRSRELYVRTERRGRDAILIAVKDSGPGIDPAKIGKIFDAFFTTKAHGMGLGLAICRLIIERHGGHLTAQSDGVNGALFNVVLPIGSRTSWPTERHS
jgi:signal transduction histidine kinase